jgi:hypothetical protein
MVANKDSQSEGGKVKIVGQNAEVGERMEEQRRVRNDKLVIDWV